MNQFYKIALVILVLFLTGCAATVQRTYGTQPTLDIHASSAQKIVMTIKGNDVVSASSDWKQLQEEWWTAMSTAAATAGIAFAYERGDISPTSESGTLIIVTVNDYRYVSAAARFAVGIATGNAYIDADVAFIDLQSRRPIGNRKYSTSSSAVQGIFSAMTPKQLESISTEIVKEIFKR
jgi:hypothetical protein